MTTKKTKQEETAVPVINEWTGIFAASSEKANWNGIAWIVAFVVFITFLGSGLIMYDVVTDLQKDKKQLTEKTTIQQTSVTRLTQKNVELVKKITVMEQERHQRKTITNLLANYIRSRNKAIGINQSHVLAESFVTYSEEFDIDPFFLTAQANIESYFEMFSKSNKGAIGIMQIMPTIWVKMIPFVTSKDDLYNPVINVRAGGFVIAHYRERCGDDYEKILRCYHGGKKALRRPKEVTKKYVRDVFYRWKKIELH